MKTLYINRNWNFQAAPSKPKTFWCILRKLVWLSILLLSLCLRLKETRPLSKPFQHRKFRSGFWVETDVLEHAERYLSGNFCSWVVFGISMYEVHECFQTVHVFSQPVIVGSKNFANGFRRERNRKWENMWWPFSFEQSQSNEQILPT